jgi:small-conductance mechanosensitive channel
MPAVDNLMTEFLLYLPNIAIACVVVFIGYLLGNFFGRAALIASVNAGIAFSGLVGKFVKFTVFIMAATMALELLGIGEDTVLIAFAVVFGGVVLSLAIAFGLGGRDAAKDYIDKMLKEKSEEDDISHI